MSRKLRKVAQTKATSPFPRKTTLTTSTATSAVIFLPWRARNRRRFPEKASSTRTVIHVISVARAATTSNVAVNKTPATGRTEAHRANQPVLMEMKYKRAWKNMKNEKSNVVLVIFVSWKSMFVEFMSKWM